jgi:drug/metabolite transporter (DMT)-like permease
MGGRCCWAGNIFTGEPITGYTLVGMGLVIGGIYWQNRKK